MAWLKETGVSNPQADTRISSLNLAWIVHRLEETSEIDLGVTNDQLARVVDVRSLVEVILYSREHAS
ncbi:hypothetical protein C5C13_11760 [Clavibacter michiganensis]|nr:hypothetical protein C5C13_11760 [Clavibacter michiganensis]